MWRSLLEVGRAQWPDGFDEGGLDARFVPAFGARQRVLVTVPRRGGSRTVVGAGGVVEEVVDDRSLLVGHVGVVGFDPDGQRFIGTDPAEGRIAQRPVFVLHTSTLPEPVEVTGAMRIEAFEEPNGRFRLLASSTVRAGDLAEVLSRRAEQQP
jgi:hypothetical protein